MAVMGTYVFLLDNGYGLNIHTQTLYLLSIWVAKSEDKDSALGVIRDILGESIYKV